MVRLAGSTHHLSKKYKVAKGAVGGCLRHTWALFYKEGKGAFNLNGKDFRLICAGQREPRRAAQTEMSARLKTSWLVGTRPTLKNSRQRKQKR